MITPRLLTIAGGVLISLSGVLNTYLGYQSDAWWYEVYPGGKMGHVGIYAGIAALVLGIIITFVLPRLHTSDATRSVVIGAVLTIVLGHLGGVTGALYIGTAGVALCYTAGIWTLIRAFS